MHADTIGVHEIATSQGSLQSADTAADRIAVALELLPFTAMLTPFIAVLMIRWEEPDIETLLLRAGVIALASGLGWIKAGRPVHGLAIALARGAVLSLLIVWAYQAVAAEMRATDCVDECGSGPLIPSIVPVVLTAVVFVASTLASTVLLARTSRRLRAS